MNYYINRLYIKLMYQNHFIIIIIFIFVSIYLINNLFYENFQDLVNENYIKTLNAINKTQEYKKNSETSYGYVPIVKCDNMYNKDDCIENGCNWFSTYCSSFYPISL